MAAPLGDGYASVGSCGQASTLVTNATQTLETPTRAFYVATDGTLQVTPLYNTVSITLTVVAGSWLPVRAKLVHACPAGTLAFW